MLTINRTVVAQPKPLWISADDVPAAGTRRCPAVQSRTPGRTHPVSCGLRPILAEPHLRFLRTRRRLWEQSAFEPCGNASLGSSTATCIIVVYYTHGEREGASNCLRLHFSQLFLESMPLKMIYWFETNETTPTLCEKHDAIF